MNKKMRFLLVGVLALAIIAPLFVFAAGLGLVPCGLSSQDNPATPQIEGACTLCDLFSLTKNITNKLITTVAPLIAVLAFSWGGFKILMSGAKPGLRQEGISAIRNGVIGLLIVFGAWIFISEFLLFFVGSSNIVTVGGVPVPWQQITCIPALLPKPKTTAEAVTPLGGTVCKSNNQPITMAQIDGYFTSNNVNASTLRSQGLEIWSSASGGTTGPSALCKQFNDAVLESGSLPQCTSLAYLPSSSINALIKLQENVEAYCAGAPGGSCTGGSQLLITGGTECGHKEHGFGWAPVDLENKTSLVNYFTSRHGTAIQTNVEFTIDGMKILYENGNHFHIRF